MADTLTVRGRLTPPTPGPLSTGYRVTASFRQKFALDPADPESTVSVPVSRTASAGTDGRFSLELVPKAELEGAIALAALAPDGTIAGTTTVDANALDQEVAIPVAERTPFTLTPSEDPTLGRPIRLTGRVMGSSGEKAAAGLPVIIWGVPEGGTEADARPLLITQTQKNGYFSGSWSSDPVGSSFGTVSGGVRIPIPLDPQKRLPKRVILVTAVATDDPEEDPCSCDTLPPRAPDAIDLVNNPAAFSADLGGGRCVNLNTPNRVVEEFSYFKVVRTTQPEIRGLTPTRPPFLPPRVLGELLELAAEPVRDGNPPPVLLRETAGDKLKLDASVVIQTLAFPELVTNRSIAGMDLASDFKQVADVVRAIACPAPGRAGNVGVAIDWDNSSLPWQATTVAHGHLLHFKQVWRADGYSLGDLLYSLPLAPCQKKEIAVVDWERQETSTREELLEEEEALSSLLSRDRDVSEIVGSTLNQNESGGSSTNMWGGGGGAGIGFIGSGFGIFAGAAGGGGGASSQAWSDSARSLSASSLQQIRDNTLQSASAVRDQRATVVQTSRQGETMRVETEVVANHNHCHAITIEYFEVLRHFQVTHELADVQECLFVPLLMSFFDEEKALRWREVLEPRLLDRSLTDGFDSAHRVRTNWLNTDTPQNRYSEESPEELEGELRITFILPRPRDNDEAKFIPGNWAPYQPFLWSSAFEWWIANLERHAIADRDRVFREEAAPRIAENMIQNLRFAYITSSGGEIEISLDATLVSRYAEGTPLYVSVRPSGGLPAIPREEISRFKVWFDGELPPDARIMVESGALRYRTPHLTYFLFNEPRILNDLAKGAPVIVATPLSRQELRSPREEDRQRSRELLAHLNKHLEWFHQILFRSFHPNRRYMLLDGFEIPDGSGRSLASVVENRLIGILGNCLVMPVARGHHLDPIFKQDVERPIDLLAHYAPTEPVPPVRVSVPTRGVYAEAVMGDCNACEKKDETRFWRWQEAPCPDEPTAIQPVSTASRGTPPPEVTPTPLPEPIINIQNAPSVPDPTGLSQALEILGRADLFKDITGLQGNQKNALTALQGAMNTAKFFGGKAADFAMQQETSKNIDRTLQNIEQARAADLITDEQARAITESALQSMIGQSRPAAQAPQDAPAVQKAIDAAAQSSKGEVTVTTPSESVQASFQDEEDAAVEEGAVGASFLPTFKSFSDFGSIGLSTLGGIAPGGSGTVFKEPAPSTARAFLDRMLTTASGTTIVSGAPVTATFLQQHGTSLIERGVVARVDPADATKFQIRLAGHICIPADPKKPERVAGSSPVPLVVIVHGRATPFQLSNWRDVATFTRVISGVTRTFVRQNADTISELESFKGFEYLQKALAQAGIASISIDNSIHDFVNNVRGARAETILTTLDRWKDHIDGDATDPCHGMIDFTNVGFLGHSRGGDAVVLAAKQNAARSGAAFKYGVRAVCSLSPTDATGSATDKDVMNPADDPINGRLMYLVVYGALDGDVHGEPEGSVGAHGTVTGTGFRHYDRAAADKAMIFLKGACHNRFNAKWKTESRVVQPDPPLMSIDLHQKAATFYIGGLFRWKLRTEPLTRRFIGDLSADSRITAAVQWSFGERRVIDTFEDPTNNAFGVARVLPSGDVIEFKDLKVDIDRNGTDVAQGRHVPHLTKILDVNLMKPLNVPRVLLDELPTPLTADSNWEGFTHMVFRLGRWHDLRTANPTGDRPRVRVSVRDDAGTEVTVTERDFVPSSASRKPFVHKIRKVGSAGEDLISLLRLDTVRIDLAKFRKGGVNLKEVSDVGISLDQRDDTHVFIDSLEIVKL